MMGKNILLLGGPQMTVWHVCVACWGTKATDTRSGLLFRGNNVYIIHTLPVLSFTNSTCPQAVFIICSHIGRSCYCSFVCLFYQVVILEHKSIICAGYSAVMHIHCAAEEVTVKVSIVPTAGIVMALLCPLRKSTLDLQKSPFLSITIFRLFVIVTVQAKFLNLYLTGLVVKL